LGRAGLLGVKKDGHARYDILHAVWVRLNTRYDILQAVWVRLIILVGLEENRHARYDILYAVRVRLRLFLKNGNASVYDLLHAVWVRLSSFGAVVKFRARNKCMQSISPGSSGEIICLWCYDTIYSIIEVLC
jgi:hypothetical protein